MWSMATIPGVRYEQIFFHTKILPKQFEDVTGRKQRPYIQVKQMKNKKYHIVETFQKSRKILEKGKIYTRNTQGQIIQ